VIETDIREIIDRDLPWDDLHGCTVLVTGAGGMLPSYVIFSLLALNDTRGAAITVHGLVRNEAAAHRVLACIVDRPDFHLLIQDVSEPVRLVGRVDYVVHGASAARPLKHATDPVGTIRANVLGTLALLDRCVVDRSRCFILMSSAEIYGHQPDGVELVDEDGYGGFDILLPRACYSEGKRAAETIAAAYHAQYGVPCRMARFGHVYGPGMALDDGRVQADFAAHVVAGTDIVLNSDGSATRTYTYVADAIAGLFYLMLCATELAYNVADARGLVSIRELAELFTQVRPDQGLAVGFTSAADTTSYNPTARQGLSSRRLEALGWQPWVDLPTGLDRMVRSLEATIDTIDTKAPLRPAQPEMAEPHDS